MKRLNLPPTTRPSIAAATLLTGWFAASACAQSARQGIGTLENARRNGKEERGRRIVNDPRYRMQQMRRGLRMAGQTPTLTTGLARARSVAPMASSVSAGNANPGQSPLAAHADCRSL